MFAVAANGSEMVNVMKITCITCTIQDEVNIESNKINDSIFYYIARVSMDLQAGMGWRKTTEREDETMKLIHFLMASTIEYRVSFSLLFFLFCRFASRAWNGICLMMALQSITYCVNSTYTQNSRRTFFIRSKVLSSTLESVRCRMEMRNKKFLNVK